MNFWKMLMIFTFVSSLPYCENGFSISPGQNIYDKDTIQVKQKSGSAQTYVIVNPPGAGTIYSNKVTILVPGIGGNASYWANDGVNSVYHLSEWSLPYMLSNQFGGDVFVYGKGIDNVFGFYRSIDWEGSRFEYANRYVDENDDQIPDFPPISIQQVTRSVHQQVIIFSPTSLMAYASMSQNEPVFLAMMQSLVRSNPALKFNLIGHSRGGLLNMKIASNSNYFRKVDHLISLGTPYFFNGLAFSTAVLNALAVHLPFLNDVIDFFEAYYCDAYSDLIQESVLSLIRTNWNSAIQDTYHTINATAYGFSMVFNMTAPFQGLPWYETGNALAEALIIAQYGFSFDSDILVGTKSQFGLGNSDFLTNAGSLINCDLFSGINDSTYLRGFGRKLFFYEPTSMVIYNTNPKKTANPEMEGVPHNLETMTPLVINSICQELE